MGFSDQITRTISRTHFQCVLVFLLYIEVSECIRLGLFTGDIRRGGAPVILRKYTHNAPVFIRISPPLIPHKPPPRAHLPLLQQRRPLLTSPRLPSLKPLVPILIPKPISLIQPLRGSLLGATSGLAAVRIPLSMSKPALPLPSLNPRLRVLDKLVQLKKSGSLTLSEFVRFKKLLLR